MTHQQTSNQVWEEVEKNSFAVLGVVTADSESRTVGIVYVVENRKLYIGTERAAWKTKHIVGNPHVSLTVSIARRVPLMPWIKVPATTISFSGLARVLKMDDIGAALLKRLYRHEEGREEWCAIEVTPEGDFITYGVGISVLQMRFPEQSRARSPVATV